MRGSIKWYHTVKHIGFLVTDDGNREVFIHINDCLGFIPEAGMPVDFEMGWDGKGRSKAVRIKQARALKAAQPLLGTEANNTVTVC